MFYQSDVCRLSLRISTLKKKRLILFRFKLMSAKWKQQN